MLELFTKAGENLLKVLGDERSASLYEIESKFFKLLLDKISKKRIHTNEDILNFMIDGQIKPLILNMCRMVVSYVFHYVQLRTYENEIENPFKAAFRVSFFFV